MQELMQELDNLIIEAAKPTGWVSIGSLKDNRGIRQILGVRGTPRRKYLNLAFERLCASGILIKSHAPVGKNYHYYLTEQ